jgi:hypothetical protein
MLGSSTGSAALGNTSLGNVSMDQMHLAPNRTSAFMSSWQSDLTGNTFSSNALTGRSAVSLLRNQGFASRVVSTQVSEQDRLAGRCGTQRGRCRDHRTVGRVVGGVFARAQQASINAQQPRLDFEQPRAAR